MKFLRNDLVILAFMIITFVALVAAGTLILRAAGYREASSTTRTCECEKACKDTPPNLLVWWGLLGRPRLGPSGGAR